MSGRRHPAAMPFSLEVVPTLAPSAWHRSSAITPPPRPVQSSTRGGAPLVYARSIVPHSVL